MYICKKYTCEKFWLNSRFSEFIEVRASLVFSKTSIYVMDDMTVTRNLSLRRYFSAFLTGVIDRYWWSDVSWWNNLSQFESCRKYSDFRVFSKTSWQLCFREIWIVIEWLPLQLSVLKEINIFQVLKYIIT